MNKIIKFLDVKNRSVHALIGALCLPFYLVWFWLPFLVSLFIGTIVEVCQYFFRDDRELKLYDRIPDALSYATLPFIILVLTIIIKYI